MSYESAVKTEIIGDPEAMNVWAKETRGVVSPVVGSTQKCAKRQEEFFEYASHLEGKIPLNTLEYVEKALGKEDPWGKSRYNKAVSMVNTLGALQEVVTDFSNPDLNLSDEEKNYRATGFYVKLYRENFRIYNGIVDAAAARYKAINLPEDVEKPVSEYQAQLEELDGSCIKAEVDAIEELSHATKKVTQKLEELGFDESVLKEEAKRVIERGTFVKPPFENAERGEVLTLLKTDRRIIAHEKVQ